MLWLFSPFDLKKKNIFLQNCCHCFFSLSWLKLIPILSSVLRDWFHLNTAKKAVREGTAGGGRRNGCEILEAILIRKLMLLSNSTKLLLANLVWEELGQSQPHCFKITDGSKTTKKEQFEINTPKIRPNYMKFFSCMCNVDEFGKMRFIVCLNPWTRLNSN